MPNVYLHPIQDVSQDGKMIRNALYQAIQS